MFVDELLMMDPNVSKKYSIEKHIKYLHEEASLS
jgi:hypothetical protein